MSSTFLYPADIVYDFKDAGMEQRYQDLISELRCLVCQNQSLADSHAELAQDLRNEVYEMIIKGESDDAITDFLVNRYGDFVLYRPPLKQKTWILWFGPVLLMFIALLITFRIIINRLKQDSETLELSEDEKHKVADLLGESDTGSIEEK